MPRSQRGPVLPYRTLAGVVPCPRGWLAATAKLQGITVSAEDPQLFTSLADLLDYKPAFQVIALFAPIGLPDTSSPGGRSCDRDARRLLGSPRANAIASAPARPVLECTSFAEAVAANGGRLSAVMWGQMKRLAEVASQIAPYWQRTVFEAHPELSFYQLNADQPVRFPKHTQAGVEERRELLGARLPGVERILDAHLKGISRPQLADAAACLWTSRRIISRAVARIPEHPEWDSLGLRMEITR